MKHNFPYSRIFLDIENQSDIYLDDHLGGFDANFNNSVLRFIDDYAEKKQKILKVEWHQIAEPQIKICYPNLDLRFNNDCMLSTWKSLLGYKLHPMVNHKNFLCSFNGTAHVSRKLLVAAINRFGWYHDQYVSKNFTFDVPTLDGHLQEFAQGNNRFWSKFFIYPGCENFFQTINSFGHVQYDHTNNIYNLEQKLVESWVHIVSETMATTYYPFHTEKFLYSVVTRGLFLAYAQPEWHAHLEKYFGFRLYRKIFDYDFDITKDPVIRLMQLMCMISKFSLLSTDDWRDLYEIEQETLEFNYDHYHTGAFLRQLESFSS